MSVQSPWKDLLIEPLTRDHLVQLYLDEDALIEAVALFAGPGLGRGDAVLLIATSAHIHAIERRLERVGVDVEGPRRWGQLTEVDAAELLPQVMVDGLPNTTLFKTIVGQVIDTARAGGRYRRLRVYGEMVDLLWKQNLPAAVRLEQLWNELIHSHSIPLLCAYGLAGNGAAPHLFPSDLRTLHSHLIPVEAWP